MNHYTHILLGVDFSEHSRQVTARAQEMAARNQAKLSLIHVVENLPITDAAYGPIPFDVDLTQEWLDASKERLRILGVELGIPEERQWLEMGSAKLELVRVAEENQVDLIVVGSHGRHGLALLLGSTANGVLHHAKCDVLAVRLKDD
jgi:universal stress protein A